MPPRVAGVTTPARARLLIIDGHSMAYRAFFALPAENFSTSTGQTTNAVYGFTSMLINLLRDESPTHVAVAFDKSSHTFRTDTYPEYKAGRAETPQEFRGQIPLIMNVLDALAIPHVALDGYEADDILATWSTQAEAADIDTLICSGDRDAFQLVTDRVTVLYPIRGVSELARMDPDAVFTKYGVWPAQYRDLAALVGESADNLPGVPKVGPKTAAKWIGLYDGLDGIVAHADVIGGVAGANLREHLDQVVLNKTLNGLLTDLDLPVPAVAAERRAYEREAVHEIFDALEFRVLRDRLFALGGADVETVSAETFDVAVSADPLADWLAARTGRVLGVHVSGGLAHGSGEAWSIAISDGESAVTRDLAQVSGQEERALADWLADPAAPKALHEAKDAWHRLDGSGLPLAGVAFDTAIAAYLCHPDQRSYALEDLALRHLQRELVAEEGTGGQQALNLDGGDADVDGARRAGAVHALVGALDGELTTREARDLLTDLELPVAWVLADMEKTGIAADVDYLEGLERDFTRAVEEAAAAAYEVIGREVNLSSPKQLQQVLFEDLEMPKTRKTKTGYTTDADALADLFAKTEHAFLQHLLTHRDAIRLRQTVESLLRFVAPDGRIHTTYSQTVAATGRLSSADPNLQNIPIRTEAGTRIREAFVVGEGFETLLTADYSQIEMRIMAHMSGDAGLIAAFNSGEDLHSFVGSRVFGVEPSEVTAPMRSKIKAMSYGLAYGLSAFGLSKQLRIATSEARGLMADYFERFGGVRDYLEGVVAQARSSGYTQTLLGRRRYLPDLTSDNRQRREMAERMALNAPIQGSAADLVKVAMVRVAEAFTAAGLASRLLLQVHDELVVEVAPGERAEVERILRAEMAGAADLSVPLEVSVGAGDSWRTAGH
ncbi:DNA polymerase I [Pseudactinotalea sp. HY160]|uniref:DNA polymerase I n=1 Tax=Pseudactinotalea sp. HY160 TaxID=2654490 RepID=UPI00128DC03B|nr:DNA polymerase I [Pseudactinotalea sp. HY160]MPV49940.1 DNA polymerase I [Pseudactinotalea sp. HY160]